MDTPDTGYRVPGAFAGWWTPGQWNEGMPYQWGGFATPEQFDRGIAEGRAAGDVYTAEKRRLLDAAVSRHATGIDCSGFISRCWRLPRSYSTRELQGICETVSWEQLQPGDVLLNLAGTIHALGPGIMIYEIQQSSDITYRLYDYGRPREIHVEKSLAVSRTDTLPTIYHSGSESGELVPIVRSPYFETVLHQLRVGDYLRQDTGKVRFHILSCIEGEAVIEWGGGSTTTGTAVSVASGDALDLRAGETVLIPASLGAYRVRGRARILRSWQP